MLAEFKIIPAPLIIDVDQRRDHSVFVPLLARLLGTDQLPQLVLRGKIVGSYHELLGMQDSGELSGVLKERGLIVSSEKSKKGIKEKERYEVSVPRRSSQRS